MNLKEIKDAVLAGKTVCWGNDNYEVIVDNIPQWLIHSKSNDHYWGLTHQDGITMNGAEREFYLKDERRYLYIATACQREVKAWVNATDEKTGRKAFWHSLTDWEQNATECIEMVDISYGEGGTK